MTPGTYLRKRREAAGVSLDLAAVAFVPWPDPSRPDAAQAITADAVRAIGTIDLLATVRSCASKIADLEADFRHVDRTITACLARIVPLDVDVYDALVAHHLGIAAPLPQLCRQCGCSWHRPCVEPAPPHRLHLPPSTCAWSETDPNLCTACEIRAAVATLTETTDAS